MQLIFKWNCCFLQLHPLKYPPQHLILFQWLFPSLAQVKNLRSKLSSVSFLDFSYKISHVGSAAKTDSKSSHFSLPLSLCFFLCGLWPSPSSCLPAYSHLQSIIHSAPIMFFLKCIYFHVILLLEHSLLQFSTALKMKYKLLTMTSPQMS